MSAADEYRKALHRLRDNKPTRVPKGTLINKDTVALEAGKKRGAIRKRPGFEELIAEIEGISKDATQQRANRAPSDRISRLQDEVKLLKAQKNTLQARYMSLLFLNFELARTLRKHNIEVPKTSKVAEFKVNSEIDIDTSV